MSEEGDEHNLALLGSLLPIFSCPGNMLYGSRGCWEAAERVNGCEPAVTLLTLAHKCAVIQDLCFGVSTDRCTGVDNHVLT